MARKGPEAKIQEALIQLLQSEGWYVFVTHGNTYQCGLPDLYLTHKVYGIRWVDVKNPKSFKLTPAQKRVWTDFSQNGSNVWILTEATRNELKKLFEPANWFYYWTESALKNIRK